MTVLGDYAKSGKPRTIPLNTTLRATLARLRQEAPEAAEWVFAHRDGTRYRRIGPTFRAICARVGLTDVSPHTLRQTFASRLAMAGVDVRTIQELGGWASLAMVQRYTHLSHTYKADAVERIASPNFPTLFTTAPSTGTRPRRRIASNTGRVGRPA